MDLNAGPLRRPCPARCSGHAHVLFSCREEKITLDLFDTMGALVCSLLFMEAVDRWHGSLMSPS
jgi:hypothetical protein